MIVSFLAEPVFRAAIHHTVMEAEAIIVHRLTQYDGCGPFGIEVGLYKPSIVSPHYIPTVGMSCSQAGNDIFPVWEHFFPLMGISNYLNEHFVIL